MTGPQVKAPKGPRPDTAWQDEAWCRDLPDFAEWPESEQADWCVGCPVRIACLDYALASPTDQSAGEGIVYGGLTWPQRRSLRRLAADARRTVAVV